MMAGIAVATMAAGLMAFKVQEGGIIKGAIVPTDATAKVVAFSDKDTVSIDVNMGVFEIKNVKPGVYTVMIDAAEPYKDAIKENVSVSEGQLSDLGEIKLDK